MTQLRSMLAPALILILLVLGAYAMPSLAALLVAVAAVIALVPFLRRRLITRPVRRVLSRGASISPTEREAMEAGSAWWEKTLFRGRPDWAALWRTPPPTMSLDEKNFLSNDTNALCALTDDWQATRDADLSAETWDFIKSRGFWGMTIPKQHGGLGFSAAAHSAVVARVAGCSSSLAVTVMVPNSLGPGELLLKYGTDEQKERYLARLASGDETPCFALTSMYAGSDATALRDSGVVCKGEFEGRTCLGLRLNWDKRYITLGPVATLLGVAVKVSDPDNLLADTPQAGQSGITCVIVPANLPGVESGRRHWPMESSFQNGPVSGRDVFVPLDYIIGGARMIGRGWRMLVECLAVGRCLSLPALSSGVGQLSLYTGSAYAAVREQFHRRIGDFEAIQDALSEIAVESYAMEAARQLAVSAIDSGEKPAVVASIVKFYNTESARRALTLAMDIHGGKAVMAGRRNYLGGVWKSLPIAITVEGANILTRSLMIFGQGAVRCHPYLQAIMLHAEDDTADGLVQFDKTLVAFARYHAVRWARVALHLIGGWRFSKTDVDSVLLHRCAQRINRVSAQFSWLADIALLRLGHSLKRREMLSGRFADALTNLYVASATLKLHYDRGEPPDEDDLVELTCSRSLHEAENSLYEICRNMPGFLLPLLTRAFLFPLGRRCAKPRDRVRRRLARALLKSDGLRQRLCNNIYTAPFEHMDKAMRLRENNTDLADLLEKLRKADNAAPADLLARGEINDNEYRVLQEWDAALTEVLTVDDFENLGRSPQ